MSTTLRGSNLINLCTPSISYDYQVQAGCAAFDNQMWEIIDDTGQVVMIPNIMNLTDSNLVDILAWQFHVDFYDATQPLEFRKQLVQLSIIWHKTKGTVQLVEDVINLFYPGVAWLQEWFEYCNPFPPNYPDEDPPSLELYFTPASVNVPGDKFTINNHGLTANEVINFQAGSPWPNSILPTPLQGGLGYFVLNPTTNSFQISLASGGAPVPITDSGTGQNEIWKPNTGTWHDRYRFRIMMNQGVIDPNIENELITLIDAFKPISRWPLDIVRPDFSILIFFVCAYSKVWHNFVSLAAPIRR